MLSVMFVPVIGDHLRTCNVLSIVNQSMIKVPMPPSNP